MTYLEALDHELAAARIPRRRRARIVAEFTDHLEEDPTAYLGSPRDIARQFADELGTRLALAAALRAFTALAFAGVVLAAMLLADGRIRQLDFSAGNRTPNPGWAAPILLLTVLSAQVALAAGGLALLRALRLGAAPVINRAQATILARRTTLAVISGLVTMAALPVMAVAHPHAGGSAWHALAWILTGVAVAALLAVVPALVGGSRLRPHGDGNPTDLVSGLAALVPRRFDRLPDAVTPLRVALVTCAAIVIVLGLAGGVADDPIDGLARGLADASACLAGYGLLSRYLGLRQPARRRLASG